MNATPTQSSSFLTILAVVAVFVGPVPQTGAQIPAIPEPPILLYGTVTDKNNNQPVTITSVTWQVTDGTTNRSYSAATLPATRIVSNGQSFYLLEVPHDTRVVQNGAGQITLTPAPNSFELKSPSPAYTLTAAINGTFATVKAVDGTNQPGTTTTVAFSDYTTATQGRMMRVDLWINEDPYLIWAAGYFANPNAPEAAPGYDFDHDGFTNEQERLAGTDPTNGTSALRFANFSRASDGTSFSLTWQSTPGKTYQVQTSTSLINTEWTPIGDPVTATGTTASLNVPTNAVEIRRFFRVSAVP